MEENDKFLDSSEEEEDEDKYEADDGFIVDDVDDAPEDAFPQRGDDDGGEVTKKRKKKKRRYREDSPELAEGDLQLLEEGGYRVDRKHKLKRLKKGASDEEDNALFDDALVEDDEEEDRFKERRRRADEPVDYDDEMDDFIDDGGRGRRRRAAAKEGLVSSEAVRQARSIFGDVGDVTDYTGANKLFKTGQDGEDEVDPDFGEATDPADDQPKRTIRDRDTDNFDDSDYEMPPAPDREEQDELIANELRPVGPTEEAELIVKTDIPERIQHHLGPTPVEPSAPQIREEAEWIYKSGFQDNPMFRDLNRFNTDEMLKKITVCLTYIHIDKLDIPFIAMYRKDYITPQLILPAGEVHRGIPETSMDAQQRHIMPSPRGFNSYRYDDFNPAISFEHARGVPPGYDDGFGDWSILWHILDMDKRYANMKQRRKQLADFTKHCERNNLRTDAITDVQVLSTTCDDEQTLKDAEKYVRLSVDFSEALQEYNEKILGHDVPETRVRRPTRRKNQYADFIRKGYRELSIYFGLSSKKIGDNLKGAFEFGQQMQVHVPIDCDSDPVMLAGIFGRRLDKKVGKEVPPPGEDDPIAERVLGAARFILASEVLADLQVCAVARKILRKPGTVSITTTPTPQGISIVDDLHPLRPVTSLSEKKIETFRDTIDFSIIQRAVNQGYTKMEVDLQPEQISYFEKLLLESLHAAEGEGASAMVPKWNHQRQQLAYLIKNKFVDQMKAEVLDDLGETTGITLRNKLCDSAARRLMLGPARPHPKEDGCPRVLAFCVTGEDDEEPDPLQLAKDAQEAKDGGRRIGDRRIARERLTIIDLDENGEYQNGYQLFAGWLRRPMNRNIEASKLPHEVRNQLRAIIARSRAQVIVIGLGSGGRRALRLQGDIMDIVRESAINPASDEDTQPRPFLLSSSDAKKIQSVSQALSEERTPFEDKRNAKTTADEVLSKYIMLTDEHPARIFARTECANIGLTVDNMTLLEKRAIALARMAQEPLWVYCGIGLETEHSIHLQFHQYHYLAKREDVLTALDRALCRSVCVVGVDINRVLRLPHMKSMLAYVAGLGVHKARALTEALENVLGEDDRGLQSRKHLWTDNYLGSVVFLSTAAYLRVRDPEIHSGGSTRRAGEIRRAKLGRKSRGRRRGDDDHLEIFEPIDDSRIHPEHYAIAIKIADEALRDDTGNLRVEIGGAEELSESMKLTSAVIDDPEGLGRLALDEYADHLEKNGRGSLFETVKMIASEFQGPFRDYRTVLATPQPAATFYLVSKADPLLFRVGSQVMATECRIRRKREESRVKVVGITCQLPHDIRGYIPKPEFADDTMATDEVIENLVRDGSTLMSRISHFSYDRFEAVLTSKSSVMVNPNKLNAYYSLVNPNDEAFRPYPSRNNAEIAPATLGSSKANDAAQRRRQLLSQAMSRLRSNAKTVVQHPFFRDINGETAIQELDNGLPGDIIIRPSPYERDAVLFSCKFAAELPSEGAQSSSPGIFHINCRVDQDPEDETIPLRLKVGDKVYEDVEQVLEQYLRPIISNMSESIDHRKFKTGSEASLNAFVISQKRVYPKNIPYIVGLSDRRPMTLVMIYIPGNTTVQREDINVVPDGYRLRSVLHKNMDVLVNWFKKNMKKDMPVARPGTAREGTVPASPFVAKSPFTGARSPYVEARSPFTEAPRSPFIAPASPFQAARSPFVGKPASPFIGRATATPAHDVPPPPAPGVSTSRSHMTDPYAYNAPPRRPRHEEPSISDTDWAKATLREDDPPPPPVQNGNHDRRPMPPRNMDEARWEQRRPAPRPIPERPPPERPMPDRPVHDRPMPNRGGPPDRRGPQEPRGPPPNSRNSGNRGRGDENARRNGNEREGKGNGRMPDWRGARPVPAWKKKAEQAEKGS